jgi:hypothetical protein
MRDSAMDLKARLLANIVKQPGPLATECWLWQGSFYSNGYGHICCDGIRDGAHRAAYREFVGPIPEGLFVCHHCDNPPCINPEHLYAGTAKENVDDMWARGRAVIYDRTGSLNPHTIVNETDVYEILVALSEGESQQVIADHKSLPLKIINDIANGRTWTHVAGPRPMKWKRHSRFVGVSKEYDRNGSGKWKWSARIKLEGGRTRYLGLFSFEVDAAIAYNTAVTDRGLDRPLNQIPDGEWCHD